MFGPGPSPAESTAFDDWLESTDPIPPPPPRYGPPFDSRPLPERLEATPRGHPFPRTWDYRPFYFWEAVALERAYSDVMHAPEIPWLIIDPNIRAAFAAVALEASRMPAEHAEHYVSIMYRPGSLIASVSMVCECGYERVLPI